MKKDHIRTLALYGEMGAGKTTITKGIIGALGGKEEDVCSPTFNIMHEYNIAEFGLIHHYDLHRLSGEGQLEEVGFFESIENARLLIIEWPNMAEDFLGKNCLKITISHVGNNKNLRHIEILHDKERFDFWKDAQ